MSHIIILPPPLAGRLAALGRRIRLLQAARGAARLVTLLALTAAAALLADFFLDLAPVVRQGLFSSWVSLGVATFLAAVVAPLCRHFDPVALAALIEEHFPQLGERLTSTVELTAQGSWGHGSPALLDLLVRDTEERTGPYDFRRAMPADSARRWTLITALALLAVLVPGLVWPQEAGARLQRFFQSWHVPPEVPPFALVVSPGDTCAARGRPLTITAHLRPRDETAVLPAALTFVATDADGREARKPMEPQGAGTFAVDQRVGGDFRYRIEAGAVASGSFTVTAVTPVDLAAESPTVTITPPAYAAGQVEAATFHGLTDLSALEHSEVRFDFRFSRPAVAARLEWTTQEVKESREGSHAVPTTSAHDLALQEGGLAATLTLPARTPGSFRLILQAEHGITTVRDGGSLSVRPDLPPAFLRASAREDLAAVLPYERLPLEVRVGDDIAVAGADLEYRIKDGPVQTESLELEGANGREAVGRLVFHLAGKAKEEDEIFYRFRARDNLPAQLGGPHTVYYPAGHWLRLKVVKKGQAIKPREIAAQREEVNRRLDAVRADLLKERRGVYRSHQEARGQSQLAPEQVRRLRHLQQDADATQKALRELSQFAGNNPALQTVADLADDLARKEMQDTRSALDRALDRDRGPGARQRDFKIADHQLASALHRLDDLQKTNDHLAQERLDQARLEELADREKHLAERAAELTGKHPARDPAAGQLAEQLQHEQAEVAGELRKLAEQSEALRQALDDIRAERARQSARRARELARAQRALAEASREAERRRAEKEFGELARREKELAQEAARLAEQTRQAAGSAGTVPYQASDMERALEHLQRGEVLEALQRQVRAVQELERLARALEGSVRLAHDPRHAARQLARYQDALRQEAEEEVRRSDADKPLAARLQPVRAEQEAVRRAVGRLSVPPQDDLAENERRAALDHAAEAVRALDRQDGRQAAERMEQARKALERLAGRLPPLAERIARARAEAARLRQEQDAIAREAEQAGKQDAAARRQAEVARALAETDTPNQDRRKERVQRAVERALDDLRDGRQPDLPQSQQEAWRQLAHLEKALAGQAPPDEMAQELARQQHELARTAADPRASAQQKLDLKRLQKQIAEQAQALKAPPALQRQREAAAAARRAAEAVQEDPAAPEAKEAMRRAAARLDDLARQLNDGESPAEQAERLAHAQAELAAEAQRQAQARPGQMPSPQAQRRQQEISQEARQVPGGRKTEGEKARALKALDRVEHATDASELAQRQREAADALRDLADRLAGRNDPAARVQEVARAERALAEEVAALEPGKPAPEEARRAADRQADLARRMQRIFPTEPPPPGRHVVQQMQRAHKALEDAQTPADAREQLARAAAATESLARRLAADQPPPTVTAARPKERPPASASSDDDAAPQGLPSRGQYERARDLARRQWELRQDLVRAVQRARAPRPGQPDDDHVAAMARQEKLDREAGNLAGDLNQLAEDMSQSPQGQRPAQQGARSAGQARRAMHEARGQMSKGAAPQAQAAQEQAAQALDRAADQVEQAAGPGADSAGPPTGQASARQAARGLRQAQEQINQARGQLDQGQNSGARASMQQAAQALQQAAQAMAQGSAQPSGQPNAGGPGGSSPAGLPDPGALGLDRTRYAGKAWGELAGELRTRIIQDMQAQYGDDYARTIKLYFEQIADTPKK
jgi:hypothetical protein